MDMIIKVKITKPAGDLKDVTTVFINTDHVKYAVVNEENDRVLGVMVVYSDESRLIFYSDKFKSYMDSIKPSVFITEHNSLVGLIVKLDGRG